MKRENISYMFDLRSESRSICDCIGEKLFYMGCSRDFFEARQTPQRSSTRCRRERGESIKVLAWDPSWEPAFVPGDVCHRDVGTARHHGKGVDMVHHSRPAGTCARGLWACPGVCVVLYLPCLSGTRVDYGHVLAFWYPVFAVPLCWICFARTVKGWLMKQTNTLRGAAWTEMSSWFSTVLGGSLVAAAAPAGSRLSARDSGEYASLSLGAASGGFSERWSSWTLMAASMAKDSGFALVDRVPAGNAPAVGDATKELHEIEASCRSIVTGVAEPTAVWKRWAMRMDAAPQERFYDGLAHEDVSLKTIILRSSALDVAVATILRKPSYASEQEQSLIEFLDRILVGSRADKDAVVQEMVKLAENVDGTASHDKIQALVISTLQQAKRDHRYEDALRETTDLLQHTAVKELELRQRSCAGEAAPADDGGDDLLPMVGGEVGDEELRERIVRSSELLDSNASLRHLVTIGR